MIVNRSDLKDYIKADYGAYKMSHPIVSFFTYGENYELFSYMRNLRYLEYYINKPKKYLWDKILRWYHWLKHRKNCKNMNIFIAPNSVGAGFHIQHRGFRHITSTTKIGSNCEILPMVLIGRKSPNIERADVIIGDNCYIAVGVTILGPVHIGNNVTIAAGAVVLNDVPDNSVVAGVPTKVVKMK